MIDIQEFQRKVGVTPDGVAGPVTFAALFRKCGATPAKANALGIAAAVHFPNYGLMESPLRLAHFMAQLMHESGKFRYMEEIHDGSNYEGRRDLGNLHPGDGKRYKGRGPIQITGRNNYRKYGRKIGIDLEASPKLAANPSIGLHLALEYWGMNGLNRFADQDDVRTVTRRINGGYNGLDHRKQMLREVKGWIGV